MFRLRKILQLLGLTIIFNSLVLSISIPAVAATELKNKRTMYSKTYQNQDQRIIRISAAPIHYRDIRGEWRDIVLDFKDYENPEQGYYHGIETNLFKSYLPANLRSFPFFKTGDVSLQFALENASKSESRISRKSDKDYLPGQAKVTYPDVWNGADLSYEIRPFGVNQLLTFSGKPKSGVVRFTINATDFSTRNENGEIVFYRGGKPVWRVEKPYIYETNNPKRTGKVSMKLQEVDGKLYLACDIDNEWLSNPNRGYPVTMASSLLFMEPYLNYPGDMLLKVCWDTQLSYWGSWQSSHPIRHNYQDGAFYIKNWTSKKNIIEPITAAGSKTFGSETSPLETPELSPGTYQIHFQGSRFQTNAQGSWHYLTGEINIGYTIPKELASILETQIDSSYFPESSYDPYLHPVSRNCANLDPLANVLNFQPAYNQNAVCKVTITAPNKGFIITEPRVTIVDLNYKVIMDTSVTCQTTLPLKKGMLYTAGIVIGDTSERVSLGNVADKDGSKSIYKEVFHNYTIMLEITFPYNTVNGENKIRYVTGDRTVYTAYFASPNDSIPVYWKIRQDETDVNPKEAAKYPPVIKFGSRDKIISEETIPQNGFKIIEYGNIPEQPFPEYFYEIDYGYNDLEQTDEINSSYNNRSVVIKVYKTKPVTKFYFNLSLFNPIDPTMPFVVPWGNELQYFNNFPSLAFSYNDLKPASDQAFRAHSLLEYELLINKTAEPDTVYRFTKKYGGQLSNETITVGAAELRSFFTENGLSTDDGDSYDWRILIWDGFKLNDSGKSYQFRFDKKSPAIESPDIMVTDESIYINAQLADNLSGIKGYSIYYNYTDPYNQNISGRLESQHLENQNPYMLNESVAVKIQPNTQVNVSVQVTDGAGNSAGSFLTCYSAPVLMASSGGSYPNYTVKLDFYANTGSFTEFRIVDLLDSQKNTPWQDFTFNYSNTVAYQIPHAHYRYQLEVKNRSGLVAKSNICDEYIINNTVLVNLESTPGAQVVLGDDAKWAFSITDGDLDNLSYQLSLTPLTGSENGFVSYHENTVINVRNLGVNAVADYSWVLIVRETYNGQNYDFTVASGSFRLTVPSLAAVFTVQEKSITKMMPVHFDAGGSGGPEKNIQKYHWDFGDGTVEDYTTPLATHSFAETGKYTVTLTIYDGNNNTNTRSLDISVTNTTSGTLYGDETWSGYMHLTGDVIVPLGKTLTIEPGTIIEVDPDCGLINRGFLNINGTSPIKVDFHLTAWKTGYWKGIVLENTADIFNAKIRSANCGIRISHTTANITGVEFSANKVGIQVSSTGTIRIYSCIFREHITYAIKGDADGQSVVMNCFFTANAVNYYDEKVQAITIKDLNAIPGNSGNWME
jgi:chitodextrinase